MGAAVSLVEDVNLNGSETSRCWWPKYAGWRRVATYAAEVS
jgi:hypothetical protein